MRISIRKDRAEILKTWYGIRTCVYHPPRNHMNDPNIEYEYAYIWHYSYNNVLYFGYVYHLSDIVPVSEDRLMYNDDETWNNINSVHPVILDCL